MTTPYDTHRLESVSAIETAINLANTATEHEPFEPLNLTERINVQLDLAHTHATLALAAATWGSSLGLVDGVTEWDLPVPVVPAVPGSGTEPTVMRFDETKTWFEATHLTGAMPGEWSRPGIDDTSAGRCGSALNLRGEHFVCDLATDHNGWAHSSSAAQAIGRQDSNHRAPCVAGEYCGEPAHCPPADPTLTGEPPAEWEKDVEDLARYRAVFPQILRDLVVHSGLTEPTIRLRYNAEGL